jgi:hypothetical protein
MARDAVFRRPIYGQKQRPETLNRVVSLIAGRDHLVAAQCAAAQAVTRLCRLTCTQPLAVNSELGAIVIQTLPREAQTFAIELLEAAHQIQSRKP